MEHAASIDVEVLIVGGGPCGLMLANELGRRKIRCLLVDSKPGTAFNPQANATQARTMEHFRRLGFAGEVRSLGLPPDHPTDIAYFTRYAGWELARLRLPTAARAISQVRTMTGSWSAAELPHRVSQKFVEAILRRHAERHGSCDIRYGWTMESFRDGGEDVSAVIRRSAGGAPVQVRACYLVGADGPRSAVRSTLGIRYGGEAGIQRAFMGGRMLAVYLRSPAFLARLRHPKAWMYVAVNRERRSFMASVDGRGEFAFHAALRPDEAAHAWSDVEASRVFHQAVGLQVPLEILSTTTWLAGHALVAERFQQGRVLLGGDAAHLFTPTGGLGYNTAVEDAVNLGWKLAAVLRRSAPAALLDSYEGERAPLARRNTRYAREFADSVGLYEPPLALEETGAEGDAARRAASEHLDRHVRLEFDIPGVTFGGRYDGSPIIQSDGTVPPPDHPNVYLPTACPGGRPPHAWLADGRSLFDTFASDWTLLALGPTPTLSGAAQAEAARLGVALTVVRHERPALRDLYEAPLALIRPDQIVAWRGDRDEDAARALARATGWP